MSQQTDTTAYSAVRRATLPPCPPKPNPQAVSDRPRLLGQLASKVTLIAAGGNGILPGRCAHAQAIRMTGDPDHVHIVAVDAHTMDMESPMSHCRPLRPGQCVVLPTVSPSVYVEAIESESAWRWVRERFSLDRLRNAPGPSIKGMNANLATTAMSLHVGDAMLSKGIETAILSRPRDSVVATVFATAGGMGRGFATYGGYVTRKVCGVAKFAHVSVCILGSEMPCDDPLAARASQHILLNLEIPSWFENPEYIWPQGPGGTVKSVKGPPSEHILLIQGHLVDPDSQRAQLLTGAFLAHLGTAVGDAMLGDLVNVGRRWTMRRYYTAPAIFQIEWDPEIAHDLVTVRYAAAILKAGDSRLLEDDRTHQRRVLALLRRLVGDPSAPDPVAWSNRVFGRDVAVEALATLQTKVQHEFVRAAPFSEIKTRIRNAVDDIASNFPSDAASRWRAHLVEPVLTALEKAVMRLDERGMPQDAVVLLEGAAEWARRSARRLEAGNASAADFELDGQDSLESARNHLAELIATPVPPELPNADPVTDVPVVSTKGIGARVLAIARGFYAWASDLDEPETVTQRKINPAFRAHRQAVLNAASAIVREVVPRILCTTLTIELDDLARSLDQMARPRRGASAARIAALTQIAEMDQEILRRIQDAALDTSEFVMRDERIQGALLDQKLANGTLMEDHDRMMREAVEAIGCGIHQLCADDLVEFALKIAGREKVAAASTLSGALSLAPPSYLADLRSSVGSLQPWAHIRTTAISESLVHEQKLLFVPTGVREIFGEGWLSRDWELRSSPGENLAVALVYVKGLATGDLEDSDVWRMAYDQLPEERRRDLFTDERQYGLDDGLVRRERLLESVVSMIGIGALCYDAKVYRLVPENQPVPKGNRAAMLRATRPIAGSLDALLNQLRRSDDPFTRLVNWEERVRKYDEDHGRGSVLRSVATAVHESRYPEKLKDTALLVLSREPLLPLPVAKASAAIALHSAALAAADLRGSQNGSKPACI